MRLFRRLFGSSSVRRAFVLTAVLAIAAALTVGPWYWRGHQQSTGRMLSGAAAGHQSSSQAGDPSEEVARFETFQFAIPAGWERVSEQEDGDDGVLLYLRGPLVENQHLVVAVQWHLMPEVTDLHSLVESYRNRLGVTAFPLEREISLCGRPAQAAGLTNDEGDNLLVFCLNEQEAFVIVMVAPANTMAQHLDLFHGVLGGLQFFE
ncbi:MAG: hypothetical protein GX358_09075 [candidate division WS1 bacterium]|nr:hypothetical protein [candidate division WS1 bacterium]